MDTLNENDERAIKAAQAMNTTGSEFAITARREFLAGCLYRIDFKDELDPEEADDDGERFCEVYVTDQIEKVFGNYEEIVDYAIDHPRKPHWLLDRVTAWGGVTGVIAITITLVISYLVVKQTPGQIQIPDILGNALTTILGFYFGTRVSGK